MARVRINRTGSLRCCFVSDTFAPLEQEQGLTKEARLDDISTFPQKVPTEQKRDSSAVKKEKPDSSGPQLKKQRVSGAFVTSSEKVNSTAVAVKVTVVAVLQALDKTVCRGRSFHSLCWALVSLAMCSLSLSVVGAGTPLCRSCMRGWWRQSASVQRQRRHGETTCVRLL